MTIEIKLKKVADIVRQDLAERFGDEFVFDPIDVIPKVDHDGDEYLHIYIVFEGDQKLLDPGWTMGLGVRIWPMLEDLGFPNPPSKSFIERSEWEEDRGKRYHRPR